jgi:hypothetical protein
MKKRSLRLDKSGQVIAITALLVSVLLLSTIVYVIETGKEVPVAGAAKDNFFPAYEQSIRSTMISALANVTSGGNMSVLKTDLDELNSALVSHSYQSTLRMDYTPLNVAPYQNGLWISWGANGKGISSAYASFVFNSLGFTTNSDIAYAVNLTSAVAFSGTYLQLNDSLLQANLTVNVQNEGNPALAEKFSFYYQNVTEWVEIGSPSITSFGNGTYAVTFSVGTIQPISPFIVSVYCQDQRGIIVGVTVTCVSA